MRHNQLCNFLQQFRNKVFEPTISHSIYDILVVNALFEQIRIDVEVLLT